MADTIRPPPHPSKIMQTQRRGQAKIVARGKSRPKMTHFVAFTLSTLITGGAFAVNDATNYAYISFLVLTLLGLVFLSIRKTAPAAPLVVAIGTCTVPLIINIAAYADTPDRLVVPGVLAGLMLFGYYSGPAITSNIIRITMGTYAYIASVCSLVVASYVYKWDIVGALTHSKRLETGDQPNYIGLMALASFLLAASSMRIPMIFIGYVVGMATANAVQSRNAMLAMTVALVAALVQRFQALMRRSQALGFAVLSTLAVASLIGIPSIIVIASTSLRLNDQYRGTNSGFSGRTTIWEYYLGKWLEHPIIGISKSDAFTVGGQSFYSHNMLLQILIDSGLLGLTGFLLFLGLCGAAACKRNVDPGLRGAFWVIASAYLAYGIFEGRAVNVGNPLSLMFFLVSIAVFGAASRSTLYKAHNYSVSRRSLQRELNSEITETKASSV